MIPLLITFLYIVFVLAAIILVVVILLQEGKGGGFGQSLGVAGQETFGVGAKGIQTFTMWVAIVFLVSAMLIHILNQINTSRSVVSSGAAIERVEGPPSLL